VEGGIEAPVSFHLNCFAMASYSCTKAQLPISAEEKHQIAHPQYGWNLMLLDSLEMVGAQRGGRRERKTDNSQNTSNASQLIRWKKREQLHCPFSGLG